MKRIGMYMALAGLFSIGYTFIDMELMLLSWINNWGETVAWLIRGGFLLGGAALYFLSPDSDEQED